MKDLFPIILAVLFVIVAVHTATHGRRGKRWGRTH